MPQLPRFITGIAADSGGYLRRLPETRSTNVFEEVEVRSKKKSVAQSDRIEPILNASCHLPVLRHSVRTECLFLIVLSARNEVTPKVRYFQHGGRRRM